MKAVPKGKVAHFDNKLVIPSSYHLSEKRTMLHQELLILCSNITKGVCWVSVMPLSKIKSPFMLKYFLTKPMLLKSNLLN